MNIIKPEVLVPLNQLEQSMIERLERYARVCYKSENNENAYHDPNFLSRLIKNGHESVIEHEKITVLFIIDRGVSHELVRHRVASYSQESTRYCNYNKEKYGNEITVIEPFYFEDTANYNLWKEACLFAEMSYIKLIKNNCSPQEARSVLPNSLKTEIVVTFNIREWRHFFKLRCSPAAHPQMKQVSIPLLLLFKDKLNALFEDLEYDKNFSETNYAKIKLTDDFFTPK